jgi:hypothetical protein
VLPDIMCTILDRKSHFLFFSQHSLLQGGTNTQKEPRDFWRQRKS